MLTSQPCVFLVVVHLTAPSSRHPPTEYDQVAYVETLSGMTKVQLAVTQVNMVKTLPCQRLHAAACRGAECGQTGGFSESPVEESGAEQRAAA